MLDGTPPAQGQVWLYVQPRRHASAPMALYPVLQSYVDRFIGGCLQLEREHHVPGLARQCVNTTSGWSSYWYQDRRADDRWVQQWSAIDAVLEVAGVKSLRRPVPEHFPLPKRRLGPLKHTLKQS